MFKVRGTSDVIKISLDFKMMANEIKVLKAMEKERKSIGVTRVLDYGVITFKNFGNGENSKVLGTYFLMPRYMLSLE